jgi:cytochrome c biogenesis factor
MMNMAKQGEFNVGWSFTLSVVASFICFAGAFLLGSGLVGRTPTKSQQSIGLFIFVAGLAVLIVSLATLSWYVEDYDYAATNTHQHKTYVITPLLFLPLLLAHSCSMFHLTILLSYGLKKWQWDVTSSTGQVTSYSGLLADGPGI